MQKSKEYWSKSLERRPPIMEPGPIPTIGDKLRSTSSPRWCWAYCERLGCGHSSPIAYAPFAIRWGFDASTDVIRERLVCSKCGKKGGVALKHPSWAGQDRGWAAWPERFTSTP